MTDHETITYRLELLEQNRAETAQTLNRLAKSQAEISADIRVLIKEQVHLTKATREVAQFQYEVKQMHSTQSRLFGRVERVETAINNLRDDFHQYRAAQDSRSRAIAWAADHWQLLLVVSGAIGYLAIVLRGLMR